MNRYGQYRVINQHTLGGNSLRVLVEHVTTGKREYHVIPLKGC